jgi:hypothetical protein
MCFIIFPEIPLTECSTYTHCTGDVFDLYPYRGIAALRLKTHRVFPAELADKRMKARNA